MTQDLKNNHHSKQEKEIKIKLSLEIFNQLLNHIPSSARIIQEINQKDVYYDREDLYITNLNRGLRIRYHGSTPFCLEFKSLFYNSKTLDNPWYIEEITFPFPLGSNCLKELLTIFIRLNLPSSSTQSSLNSANTHTSSHFFSINQIENILSTRDLKPVITVNKHRKGYQINSVQYLFDYIEDLGYFLEIESEQENPLKILDKLNLDNYQIIRNGYNDMLATNVPAYLPNEEKQKRFKENPKWNILPNEIKIVDKLLSKA